MVYDADDVLRSWVLSDSLHFSRYFFKLMNGGKKFVVGKHHRMICDKLNDVLTGKTRRLIINIAPRYSKSELVSRNFIAMGLAINPAAKFIHLSYSGDLALGNSVAVKDIVKSEDYQRLFGVEIAVGTDTKSQWNTTKGGGLYATSSLGQVTGFGAGAIENEGDAWQFGGAIVIDDPIKPADALSDNNREAVNLHFETTIRNRVNSRNTPIIIIMQRLHEHDLCGYLMELEPDEWEVLSVPCISYNEDGEEEALWPFKHTIEELHKIESANQFVFDTQYMQNPKPLEGLMYSKLRTYDILPMEQSIRKNYTDTADKGADFLCSVCYVETPSGMYVTDVLYTDKPMEYTEVKTAEMLLINGTQLVKVESNNGGEGFARNVEKNVRLQGTPVALKMRFTSFFQGLNKNVRIFSHSAEVQNLIFFPSDWETRWPQFAQAVKGYRKVGRNAHDDAPDVLTGMVENFTPVVTSGVTGHVHKFRNAR